MSGAAPTVPELVTKLDRTLSKSRFALSEITDGYSSGQVQDLFTTAIDAIGADFQTLKTALEVK